MNISQQKLDIDQRQRALYDLKSRIETDIKILKRGMDALDEGINLLEQRGILAQEVRKIMTIKIEY